MIEKLTFGRSRHLSTRTLFGGAGVANVSRSQAEQALELLLEYGVNHIDTAPSYGDGTAEENIGFWLKRHRERFFLATKTLFRTRQEAWEDLQSSLRRLGVERVDLIQMHNLVDPEEWKTAMGLGGALEALIEAREKGLVRFIGVTGHGLSVARMHLRSLERFDFDSVLLPLNYPMMQNPEYAADFRRLNDYCREKQVAVQTIKSIARGPWGDKKPTRATWYEPLEEQQDIDRAVHWVLGHPGTFLNTAGDLHVLPRVLKAAANPQPQPSDQEMRAVVEARALEPLFS